MGSIIKKGEGRMLADENCEELNDSEVSIIKYMYNNNGISSNELMEMFNINLYELSKLINNMLIIKNFDKYVLTGRGQLFMSQYFYNKKVTLKTLRF